jgi:hypothetical protein
LECQQTNTYTVPTTYGIYVGRTYSDNATELSNGYISNLRILSGTALYTNTFTPPTAPLTAITNTTLLTCQSNRFFDSNTQLTAKTVSVGGGAPTVQAFQPFSPPASYTTAAYGGSGYFGTTGDSVVPPQNSVFNLSTGNWTIEAWFYAQSLGTGSARYITITPSAGSVFGVIPGGGSSVFVINLFGSGNTLTSTVAPTLYSWQHVAIVKNSSTTTVYLNGVSIMSGTVSWVNANTTIFFGGNTGSYAYDYFGYISNARVVMGTAVYTAAFTPPTAPVTAIANTSLLLNYTNAGIYDAAVQNNAITVGDAQASTTVSKWSPTSMKFDGTGDYLSIPSNVALDCKTGDWTIECWVYVSSRTLNYPLVFGNNRGSFTTDALGITNSNADNVAYNDKFCLAWGSAGFSAQSAGTAGLLVSSVTNSTGTWYYLAVVRSGTSVKIYRDGSQVANATVSAGAVFNWGFNGTLIGGGNWDAANSYFSGYLQDLRITRGVARTISTPTLAFPTL